MEYLVFSKLNSSLFIKCIFRVGEMAQWLGALATIGLESQSAAHNCLKQLFQRALMSFSVF